MEITIKIEAPALVDAINSLAVAIAGNMELLLHKGTEEKFEALPQKEITESEPAEVEEQKTKPTIEEHNITIEEIRSAFIAKNSNKQNTSKLKALLAKFGAGKVTDLKPEDFPEILKDLEAL